MEYPHAYYGDIFTVFQRYTRHIRCEVPCSGTGSLTGNKNKRDSGSRNVFQGDEPEFKKGMKKLLVPE